MTRTLRRFLWFGGGLVLVFAGAALAVPYLVDLNRYHDLIESQAEKALGRNVGVGRMRLVLLPVPGVSVEPLSIGSDRPGDPPLLKTESLAAHARLLPLLRGRIEVASLVARRPELKLHRHSDGRWNLPDFPAAASSPGAPSSAPAGPAGGGLSLSRVRIHRATLYLVDEAVLPGRRVTTTLEGVDLAIDGFAPGRPFGLRLDADLPPRRSGSFSLAGTLALPPDAPGRSAGTSDFTVTLRKLQPSAFAPYLRAFTGIDPPSGSISADLEAQARLRSGAQGAWELEKGGSLRGKIGLRDVALPGGARDARPIQAGDLDVVLDLALGERGRRIDFRRLEVTTGKTRLAGGGSLELGDGTAWIDLKVRPSEVMADDLATVAAVLGARFPPGLTSSAPISFSGSASGPLDQPERMKFRGEIALSGVRYADPTLGRPIEDVGGKLIFEEGALRVSGFTARVNQTRVAGSLEVRDFRSPQVTLALSSPRANLDDLLALLTPASAPGTTRATAATGEDVLARTRGSGSIRIEQGSFGTFRFSRFDGSLHLEGKRVTFDPVSFLLYGGAYNGALTADLRGRDPRYSYRSTLAGVDGQQFLAENLELKDLLAGTVWADLTLDGGGKDLDHILQSLKGHGSVKVEKGWIGELNVLKGLAKASDLLGERTLSRVSGELAKSRTDFSALTADLEIAGGRVTTRNLKVLTRDLDLLGRGGFTLAGILDLDLKALFSPDLTRAMLAEGSRARYLDREGDRIVLPLTIRGPLASPTYGVNLESIARAAARSELGERLGKSGSPLGELAGSLIGRRSRGAPSTGGPSAEPPAPPEEAPTAPPAGDSAVRITSRKYEGSFLLPDLTIRGDFIGTGLARADLKVEGQGGGSVFEKNDAFQEITAYYATHDRSEPARIPFKTKIDGKRLAGAGDLKITITVHRADGTSSVTTFSQEKRGL